MQFIRGLQAGLHIFVQRGRDKYILKPRPSQCSLCNVFLRFLLAIIMIMRLSWSSCLQILFWSCFKVLCKILILSFPQNIQLFSIISDSPLWWVCFVLLCISFSAYSSVLLATIFSLLICLSKYHPWLSPSFILNFLVFWSFWPLDSIRATLSTH